jgi:hypothetical protein
MDMRSITAMALAALFATMALAQTDSMKCKGGWERAWSRYSDPKLTNRQVRPYFHCDFTTRTCERGYTLYGYSPDLRIVEVLAPDRTTVIGHLLYRGGIMHDFDTGIEEMENGLRQPIDALLCAGGRNLI